MKPFEMRQEGRGILGRKLCGCIVAVNLGYTDRERREMEAEYVVSEHTYAEAREMFNGFDHHSCLHGPAEAQLMAEVQRLERERALLQQELENIANAKPREWGEMADQFQPWAQSRARHVLGLVNSQGREGAKEVGAVMNLEGRKTGKDA